MMLDHIAALSRHQTRVHPIDTGLVKGGGTVRRQRCDVGAYSWGFNDPFCGLPGARVGLGRGKDLASGFVGDTNGPLGRRYLRYRSRHYIARGYGHGNGGFRGREYFPPSVILSVAMDDVLFRSCLDKVCIIKPVDANPTG